jgi:hypothetical protein
MASIDPIQLFKEKLAKDFTRISVCGRPYVFVESLQTWLRSAASAELRQIDILLFAVYPRPGWAPIKASQISDERECSLLIFSILLELDCGKSIDALHRKGVFDSYLSSDSTKSEPIRNILTENKVDNAAQIAEKFESLRWRYCPAKFELGMARDFGTNRILPIHKRQAINEKGGTAQVWEIVVPEEFVSPELAKTVSSTKFLDTSLRIAGMHVGYT